MEPVRIFNPSTITKIVVLPYQTKYSRLVEPTNHYSLGYEPVEKRYKVLMQVDYSYGHVRNYSIDKSWRKIKDIFDFFTNFHIKAYIHIPSQRRDVEDITKLIYCPPEGFYYYRNEEIIFITIENSISFCNFYDIQKNNWRHLKIHGSPTRKE